MKVSYDFHLILEDSYFIGKAQLCWPCELVREIRHTNDELSLSENLSPGRGEKGTSTPVQSFIDKVFLLETKGKKPSNKNSQKHI